MATPKTPPRAAEDAQLDVIPMKKVSPVAWAGVGMGVLLVVGLGAFGLAGGSKDKARVDELRAHVEQASSSARSPEELKAQREHLAMTQRALEAAEQKKKLQEVEAALQQEQQRPQAEPPSAGVQPPPVAAKPAQPPPKGALDSIESEALKGLE